MDGHGEAEAGFKISKHWLAMELTEGVQDIWNQNKPDEVRSKYNLSNLIHMLKEKNDGNSICHPRCGFDGEKKTREWRGLDGAGGWGPAFPTAEPRTPQPEVVNARHAMAVKPLDSPDVCEKRGRGSRRIPCPDGAIITGGNDSPGRLRKRHIPPF